MPGDVFILHCIFTKPRNTIFCLMIDLWGYTTAIIYVFGYLQAWIGLIIACMALVSGSMCVQCMNYSSYKTVFLTARNEMCNRALTNISQLDGEFWTSGVEKKYQSPKEDALIERRFAETSPESSRGTRLWYKPAACQAESASEKQLGWQFKPARQHAAVTNNANWPER